MGDVKLNELTATTNSLETHPVSQNELISLFVLAKHDIYVDGLLRVIGDLPNHEIRACVNPEKDCFEKFTRNRAEIILNRTVRYIVTSAGHAY